MLIFSSAKWPLFAVVVLALQGLPPLGFAGFRAHMPMSEARALTASAGGTLACKPTTDPRLRECNGVMPYPKVIPRFSLLISSVRDTAAVIVLTASVRQSDTRDWARDLTRDFGEPDHKTDRVSERWQWVRKGQMLRVIQHKAEGKIETAITLTDGPLLDALGPPPPISRTPEPKSKKPD